MKNTQCKIKGKGNVNGVVPHLSSRTLSVELPECKNKNAAADGELRHTIVTMESREENW